MAKATKKVTKKKVTKKKTTKRAAVSRALTPKVVGFDDVKSKYANFAQVRASGADVTVIFCQIKPPHEDDLPAPGKSKNIDAPAKVAVVMPPDVAKSLARALENTIERSEKGKGRPGN